VLTFALYGLLAIGLVGGLFMLAARLLPAGEQIAPPIRDEPLWVLPPDRALSATDVAEVRLPVALRGYRFAETDLLLDRLGEELRARDEEIARLRGALPTEDPGVSPWTAPAKPSPPVAPDAAAADETVAEVPAEESAGEESAGEESAGEESAGEESAGEASAGEESAGEASADEPEQAPPSYWGGSAPSARTAGARPEPVTMADAAPEESAAWWGKPAPTGSPEAPAEPPRYAAPRAIPQPDLETGLAPTWWQPPPSAPSAPSAPPAPRAAEPPPAEREGPEGPEER
jgi:hypothetical protein